VTYFVPPSHPKLARKNSLWSQHLMFLTTLTTVRRKLKLETPPKKLRPRRTRLEPLGSRLQLQLHFLPQIWRASQSNVFLYFSSSFILQVALCASSLLLLLSSIVRVTANWTSINESSRRQSLELNPTSPQS
jgi:hypothetical protein